MTITELPSVIYACFVLRNYCELNDNILINDRIEGAICYERESQPALMREINQGCLCAVLRLTGA